jgi:DNA-binding SARP family transcriptional activator
MIEFRTFGAVEVAGTGASDLRPVLNHPKRVGLLAYLAVSRVSQPRERLVRMFWPQSGQDKARGSLRQAVHHLRRSLGATVLVSQADDSLGIAPGTLDCDAVRLEECCGESRWAAAAEIYRGAFLSGLTLPDTPEFTDWLERRREQFDRMAREASATLQQQTISLSGGPVHERSEAVSPHPRAYLRNWLLRVFTLRFCAPAIILG